MGKFIPNGKILTAYILDGKRDDTIHPDTPAILARGLRYEAQIGKILSKYYPDTKIIKEQKIQGLQVQAECQKYSFICYPDFLMMSDDKVVIVEVKLNVDVSAHLPELKDKYYPVLQHLTKKPISGVLIGKSIKDSREKLPRLNISSLLNANPDTFYTCKVN